MCCLSIIQIDQRSKSDLYNGSWKIQMALNRNPREKNANKVSYSIKKITQSKRKNLPLNKKKYQTFDQKVRTNSLITFVISEPPKCICKSISNIFYLQSEA